MMVIQKQVTLWSRGILVLGALNFLLSAEGRAASLTEAKAHFVCHTLLTHQPYEYGEHFSKPFREVISKDYLNSIAQDLIESVGLCQRFQILEDIPPKSQFLIQSVLGNEATFTMTLDEKGLIEGLSLQSINLKTISIQSWQDLFSKMKELPGQAAVTYRILNSGVYSGLENRDQVFEGQRRQPIGSGFKLYVLGALVDELKQNTFSWNSEYPITASWKSLPSGVMQTWENGRMVSLFDYASYMIKVSDNTATDHLIQILGRQRVENQLPLMKNDYSVENRPFLLTSEMFKIKWVASQEIISSYLSSDEFGRRAILENQVTPLDLAQIGTNGVDGFKPFLIHDVEWFASTNDLCEAMDYLRLQESPEVLQILKQNTPFVDVQTSDYFDYAGFKGGSEAGVVTMTYLFHTKADEWSCLSMAWNNKDQNINQTIFQDMVKKTIQLISTKTK